MSPLPPVRCGAAQLRHLSAGAEIEKRTAFILCGTTRQPQPWRRVAQW